MKKIFEYIGIISLVCFSFFLTDKTVSVVQEVDDIMIQIKTHQEEYNEEGKDAIVVDKNIIPGMPSRKVDLERSYQEMKKIGVYDPNYFVYHIEKPKENLDNHLDKYISEGNAEKRMVSLVFILKENSPIVVLDKIGEKQVSFVVSNYDFENVSSDVETTIQRGNDFLISEESEQKYLSMKQKLETFKNPLGACYNEKQDEKFLAICKKNHYYSFNPKEVIVKTPLTKTKELLKPGSILTFEVNKQLLVELPNIISYIESRGYVIEPLSTHIKED